MTVSKSYSQEVPAPLNSKRNTVYLKSNVFTWASEFGLLLSTVSYERLMKSAHGYVALSVRGGLITGITDYFGVYPAANVEIDGLFGKRSSFFEIGTGVNLMAFYPLPFARVGYRLMPSKRFMFRCSYEIMFPNIAMGFSLGFGYRFGKR